MSTGLEETYRDTWKEWQLGKCGKIYKNVFDYLIKLITICVSVHTLKYLSGATHTKKKNLLKGWDAAVDTVVCNWKMNFQMLT